MSKLVAGIIMIGIAAIVGYFGQLFVREGLKEMNPKEESGSKTTSSVQLKQTGDNSKAVGGDYVEGDKIEVGGDYFKGDKVDGTKTVIQQVGPTEEQLKKLTP